MMEDTCKVPSSLAHRAVRLSYVWPLLLFLAVLLGLSLTGFSEIICALAAFAVLALYYGVLALLRSRLEKIYQIK